MKTLPTPASLKSDIDRQSFRQMMAQAVELQKQGHFNAAEGIYLDILDQMPGQTDALHFLGLLKHQSGKSAEGIKLMKKSVELGLLNSGYLYNLGNALKQQGQLEEAIDYFNKVLQLSPSYAAAWSNLAEIYSQMKMPFKACEHYRKAFELDSNQTEIAVKFVRSLYNTGELAEAIDICKRRLHSAPDDIEFIYLLVSLLWDSTKTDEALRYLRSAIMQDPMSAVLQHSMGIFMSELGEFDAAVQHFQNALSIDPNYYQAYVALTSIKTATSNDPLIPLLESKLNTSKTHEAPLGFIALQFSLGKLHQDLNQYDDAFKHFLEGNRTMRGLITYKGAESSRYVDGLITHLNRDFLAKYHGCANETEIPIFILGMSRSGTSLVEQVLAAHPKVMAGGELPYLPQSVFQQVESAKPDSHAAQIAALSSTQFCAIGGRYLDKLSEFYPGAHRVTDKLPGNFMLIGLIKTLFPRARIIHCERDPLDTCVSCFTTLFQMGHEFTYDLVELGEYYQLYRKLMRHWADILDTGSFLTIKYEEFVSDIENCTRQILEYCGLDWDARCLQFGHAMRPVKTASLHQVRQPANTRSIGRWEKYADYLEPLQKVLARNN